MFDELEAARKTSAGEIARNAFIRAVLAQHLATLTVTNGKKES